MHRIPYKSGVKTSKRNKSIIAGCNSSNTHAHKRYKFKKKSERKKNNSNIFCLVDAIVMII